MDISYHFSVDDFIEVFYAEINTRWSTIYDHVSKVSQTHIISTARFFNLLIETPDKTFISTEIKCKEGNI